MNKNSRNIKLDYIKTFAIVFVILGHAIQLFNGADYRNGQSFYDNSLYKLIYSFHMPLFMLASGYLYYDGENKYEHNFSNNLKKVNNYFIPIISFAIIKTIVYVFNNQTAEILTVLKNGVYNVFHVLWFLWAIIYSIMMLEIIKFMTRKTKYKKRQLCVGGVLLVLLFTFMLTPDMLMGNVYKYVIPYFGMGYILNHFKANLNLKRKRIICIVSGVIWLVLLVFYDKNAYIYTTGFSILFSRNDPLKQMFIDGYRWIIGAAGSCFIWMLFDCLIEKGSNKIGKVQKCIGFIGSNTIIIYSFSTEILNEIFYGFTKDYEFNYIRTILFSALMLMLCLFIAFILNLKYMNMFKKLLTGR